MVRLHRVNATLRKRGGAIYY